MPFPGPRIGENLGVVLNSCHPRTQTIGGSGHLQLQSELQTRFSHGLSSGRTAMQHHTQVYRVLGIDSQGFMNAGKYSTS